MTYQYKLLIIVTALYIHPCRIHILITWNQMYTKCVLFAQLNK